MGLEDQIVAAGYDIKSIRSVGADGNTKADVDAEVFRNIGGADFTSLPRGDLAGAVYDTIDGEIDTRFGDSITSLVDRPGAVGVTFEHAPADEFDLVIGADGLHSNARRLVFGPDEAFEHYLGCKVAACVVDGYRPRDELVYVTYNTPGRQVARFALRGDRTMFLFVWRAGHDDRRSPKEQLRNAFGDAGWECEQILAAVDTVDELYFDVVSQIKMDRWSQGRVL